MAYAPATHHAQHSNTIETLARAGYATKGVVYMLIGGLATLHAFREGGRLTDSKGAVETIAQQPFGQLLLWATGIGLAGYALWRLIQAVLDPEGTEKNAKRMFVRLGYAASAVIHGALALLAVQMAMGNGGGGKGEETWVAKALAAPGGTTLVLAAGLGVIAAGLYAMVRGFKASFVKHWRMHEMSPTERTWSVRAGRLGLISRGIVFTIIGYFLLRAASSHRASEFKGVGEALATIAAKPYGQFMLAVIAIGLMAYAVYEFVNAKYRRIDARV